MSLPRIEIQDGAFLIDASVIATGLDVEATFRWNFQLSGAESHALRVPQSV